MGSHRETSKRSLVCTSCGYGIVRSAPPKRCPMCQVENAWKIRERLK